MNPRVRLSVSFACIAATALASTAFADGAVSLKMKLKAGDQFTYQTVGQISIPMPGKGGAGGAKQQKMPDIAFPVNATQTISVTKVASSGSADIDLTISGTTGIQTGGIGPSNRKTTAKATISPSGALAMAKHANESGANAAVGALTGTGTLGSITIYLPSHPVKPGDTWSVPVPLPQLSSTGTASAKYVGNTQVGRYKTAHIKLTISIPVHAMLDDKAGITRDEGKAQTTVNGKMTMVYEDDFAIAEGRLIRSTGAGTTDIVISQKAKAGKAGGDKPKSQAIVAKTTMSSTLTQ